MSAQIILFAVLAVAVIGKAYTVAVATGILLIVKLAGIDKYIYPSWRVASFEGDA
ncbi:MAG TPA: hypothetical protein PKA19_08500, partial [Bacillota bacterium]|nr:hypothetical protein [Bacillota bacterium]